MKILQVLAGAEHGGAETAFVDMCLALQQAGETIEVITRPNPVRVPLLEDAGIKVHTARFGGILDFLTPRKINNIIRQFQPQIVQTWMARATWKTPPCLRTDPERYRYLVCSRLGGYYNIKYFKAADYFITITPDIRDYLVKEGIAADHIRHINNFAETEKVIKPVERNDLGTPDDAFVFLSLGRLHQAKAFDTLLTALKDVPDAYLWIAGEGPDKEKLTALCTSLGLGGRVRFLGWRNDRAALFQAADACVFPSRYEPFGTVFVQAWAQTIPLVTTASQGPAQYVRDGEDGLMVTVDDVEALANAMKRIMNEPELQKTLVENGLKRYQNEFTKEKAVRAYLDYYRECLEKENIKV